MREKFKKVELDETKVVKNSNKVRTHFGYAGFLMATHFASEWFYTLLKVQGPSLFGREIVRKAEGNIDISAWVMPLVRQR